MFILLNQNKYPPIKKINVNIEKKERRVANPFQKFFKIIARRCMEMADRKRSMIRNDLIRQLESKGAATKYYLNLVEDYMFLYDQKEMLQKNIEENGAIVEYVNSRGIPSRKKNEACDMLLKTNMQMLKTLEFLRINPNDIVQVAKKDEEDEL